jgi:ribosomal protein L22
VSPEKDQPDETEAATGESVEDTQARETAPAAERNGETGAQQEAPAKEAPAKRRRARAKKAATDEPLAQEASETAEAPETAGASETAEAPEAAEASETKGASETAEASASAQLPQKEAAPRRRRGKKATDAVPAGEAATAAKLAKPARARRSAKGAKRPQRRRVVRAQARYVRTSARKARLVSDHLRGRSVQEARAILAYAPREVARDWSKLLDSAVANAENNHELLEDDLIVREAYADEGPTIKRFRPRAMGRATPIRKRTSHLTIALIARPEPQTNKRNR